MSTGTGLSDTDKQIRERDRQDASRRPRQSMGGPLDTGTTDKLDGDWVVGTFTSINSQVRFRHDLNATTRGIGNNEKPNVTWLQSIRHDGTGTAISVNVEHQTGDYIGANEIVLRIKALGRTVDEDHPLTAALFFQKAEVPW